VDIRRAKLARTSGVGQLRDPASELRYVTGVTGQPSTNSIVLGTQMTGARVLHELLLRAAAQYPDVFADVELPRELAAFRTRYPELLPQFEARRRASPQANEIARFLYLAASAQLVYVDREGTRPLFEALHEPAQALPLVRLDLPGARGLRPSADFRGRHYEGREVAELARELEQRRLATPAASRALTYLAEHSVDTRLSLEGERFVLFGAGAELSPVYTLLEAGAEVLWIDLLSPPIDHLLEPRLGGRLHYVAQGADLLAGPAAIRQTVLTFAAGAPVRFGMYAFASGDARALRLSFSMNELVRSLPSEVVGSISYLLSPTSVSPIAPEDAACADQRRERATRLQRALFRAGPLQHGHVEAGDARISCAVVAQQGASFQVAEYIGKRLAAEAFAAFGNTLEEPEGSALSVWANTAPITATRSLASPLLEAALLGTPGIGVLIAEPSSARALSALLTVHDVLAPEGQDKSLFCRQIHGGVHAQPYALDGLIRVAALRGIAQRPLLALELWR
jgi:hypothetical protein